MAAKRHQKAINVYGKVEIERVREAMDAARTAADAETETDAAVEMADAYLQHRAAEFSNPPTEAATRTLRNAVRAAIESGDAETEEEAIIEIAAAYTGWTAPR